MTRLLSNLFGTKTPAKPKAAKLSVQALEAREVPAGLLSSNLDLAAPIGHVAAMSSGPKAMDGFGPVEQNLMTSYFKTNADIANFIGEPAKLYGKPELNDFFTKYSDAITAIRVGTALANANDLAAAKLVFETVANKLIANIAPTFSTAFNVYGWVHTGMELLKDYVVDPALDQQAISNYNARRDAFGKSSPGAAEDAYAALPGVGHLLEIGQKKFEQMYNPKLILIPGTDQLKPAWQRKLERDINEWLEGQYQLKLLQDTKTQVGQLQATAEGDKPGYDTYMIHEMENQFLHLNMTINPKQPQPFTDVDATVIVTGVKDFSKLSLQVSYNLVGTDGYTQADTLTVDSTGHSAFVVPGGDSGVQDSIDLNIVDTTVKHHHTYHF
jgi:hypothetical protein